MFNPWTTEFWRIAGVAFVALVIGLATGHVIGFLLLGTLAYLIWHLVHLARLERWLRTARKYRPPEASGIWGEVYHHFYRLQQRNRKRKLKLAAILNQFQEAAAALPDAAIVLRATGEIEWFNEAAVRLLGLRAQDVGLRIANLVRHPAFTALFPPGAEGAGGESAEFPSPVDDSITLLAHVVPYGQDRRLLVVRDVTRLHRLEQMRRDFVANVSHELRTPLTVVMGYLETMEDGAGPCAQQWARSLHLMRQQTLRMQRIVTDLLLLARLETENRVVRSEPVDVPALLAAIREDALALSGEKGHVVQLAAEPDLWLLGSAEELRSAFSNLVFNAVQYTPEGGEITIRWYGDAAGAHLVVKDTGVGIAAHHIPRLTERFYRVDVGRSRERGGTGLGLAIVKHVLSRHEGRLRIASVIGQGSTFTCDFPARLVLRRPEKPAQANHPSHN